MKKNATICDYNESTYEISSDCKCTMPNLSKIKPKIVKLLLKSYDSKKISNNDDENLIQLKEILKDDSCLCLFNKNCSCYKARIECFSKCACKMRCKNNYLFYNQK